MKRFTSEKAFTLVEMSVVLSVVALIGSLLVGGVVAASNNRASADVLEFFDKEIEQAYENFRIDPQPVLSNQGVLPAPYQSMHYSNLTGSVPGFQYAGFYTENLVSQSGASTGASKYMLQIIFEQEEGIAGEVEGFNRNLVSYQMKAMVLELIDGKYDSAHPLLERTYRGISAEGQVEWSNEKNISITYRVDDSEAQPATIHNYTTGKSGENTLVAKFASGDQFYSQKVAVISHNSDKAFVGWSSNPTSREVIPSGTKITSDMTVYAVFSEYRVEFQLQQGQQFDPAVVAPPNNDKNYFIEADFTDFPGGQATIEDIAKEETEKQIVTKLLDDPDSQVIQAGYEFKGWRNAVTKDPISEELGGKGLETVLMQDDPYLQLEAVMVKIEADESKPLQLSLDLSNYTVEGRKFFLYNITDLEYKVTYDKDTKSLGLVQTEYNTWNGKTEKVSEIEFTVGDEYLSIVDEDGTTYENFETYFRKLMGSGEGKYVVLDSVELIVKAPTFDSSTYQNAPEATKDKVYFNGAQVSTNDLKSLDVTSSFDVENFKYSSETLDGVETTQPMDEEDYDALNAQLLTWYGENQDTYRQVEVFNVAGSFKHTKSNAESVYQRTETIETSTPAKVRYSSREISYSLVVPLSLLNNTMYYYPVTISCSMGVDSSGYIYIDVSGTIPAYMPLFAGGGADRINTGIPYKEEYKGQTIYNRISTIKVTGDLQAAQYNVSATPTIINGNGPENGKWFPASSGLNEIYDAISNAKMKVEKIPNDNAFGSKSVYSGCQEQWASYCNITKHTAYNQLNKGIYAVRPVPKTNPKSSASIYVMSTSYPSKDIPTTSYGGDWQWSDSTKEKLKADFVDGGGNANDFDQAWTNAMNDKVMIVETIPGSSTPIDQIWYSFNNGNGAYTSLPAGFSCKK